MAEGIKLTDEEMLLVKKLLEDKLHGTGPTVTATIHHGDVGEDNDCFCDMDLDPGEATDDADLPAACGGVVE